MKIGTQQTLKALRERIFFLLVSHTDIGNPIGRIIGKKEEVIAEFEIPFSKFNANVTIDGYTYLLDFKTDDLFQNISTCFLYIHDCGYVSDFSTLLPNLYIKIEHPQVVANNFMIHEAAVDKIVESIKNIQEALNVVWEHQGIENIKNMPVLEITPGGVSFVVGERIVVDSSDAKVALQTVLSSQWSE